MVALERELREPSRPAPSTITADAIPLALRRRGASARQVLALAFVGVLTLALFASRDLPSWVGGLGSGPVIDRAQALAVQWDHAMASLGLTRPHEALRALIRRLLDAQW
jgi:hypothetical protein